MEYLSVKDVAELRGCSAQYIRKSINNGSIRADKQISGNGGKQYRIPLSELEPSLQRRWYQKHEREMPLELRKAKAAKSPPAPGKTMEELSADEREEAAMWIRILEDWQAYRAGCSGSRAEADTEYIAKARQEHPDIRISYDILQRKLRAHKAGSVEGLVDKRGAWKRGTTSMDKDIADLFTYWYWDEHNFTISKCRELTVNALKLEHPELVDKVPSYDVLYRYTKTLPMAVCELARGGEKAHNDRCGVFVDRLYDDMLPNDYWIADGHTIDVISKADDGTEKRHRLTLSAFLDARSGIYVGWVVTDNPCSDATLLALRKAILRYGIPKNIYVDNGREYLNTDIGGLGHRTKKRTKDQSPLPTPILARLGIQMTNALPRNGQAKIIERAFKDFTFLSKLFDTYTGNTPAARPEKLKRHLKAGHIPLDGELSQVVEDMIEGYFNLQPYKGKVVSDRGLTKMEVYRKHIAHAQVRMATEEDLGLMLMRSARLQTVGRNGVHLPIGGERIYYSNDELMLHYQGKRVYIRYDPENLDEVRIYDEEERFIMTAPMYRDIMLPYGAGKDDVKKVMAEKRRFRRLAKEQIDMQNEAAISRYGHLNALDVMVRASQIAREGLLAGADDGEPKVVELVQAAERQLARAAGGEDYVVEIDKARMIRNNERRGDDE